MSATVATKNLPLDMLADADTAFEHGGSIDTLISAYESALGDVALSCDERRLKLIDLYLFAGRTSDAWNYMNRLSVSHPALRPAIRRIQFDMFKNAGRGTDALACLAQHYLLAFKYNDAFDRISFLREANGVAADLDWNEGRTNALADIVERYVDSHNTDESLLRREIVQACMQFRAADERGWSI